MPTGLVRSQQRGHLHFVTFSCFRHRQILGTPEARETLLEILEQTRKKYRFDVHAYVVMPDHVHLVLSEPKLKLLGTVLQVVKQRFSRTRQEEEVWERRYYDFNIASGEKLVEKVRYIHRNPVRRGLAERPEDWEWSSFRFLLARQSGPVALVHPSW